MHVLELRPTEADNWSIQLVSRVHALAAAFRAVNDLIEGQLRSRNVHSEIVFALSPNNNVSCGLLRPLHFSLARLGHAATFTHFMVPRSIFGFTLSPIISALKMYLDFVSQFRLPQDFEVVPGSFCSKNSLKISESFRRFGITPTTNCLLVFKISTPEKPITASAVQEHLHVSVKGTQVAFDDNVLEETTNWASVRKYYKLGPNSQPKGEEKALVNGTIGEEERRELEIQILGAMALRGVS